MRKTGGGFCLNRIIRANARVRSPTIQSGHELNSTGKNRDMGKTTTTRREEEEEEKSKNSKRDDDGGINGGKGGGRRIAVVVDSSSEAKNALLWTLSHCAQEHDTLLLLHFLRTKPSSSVTGETCGADKRRRTWRACERVSALKNICLLKRPQVNTEVVVVEGEEKGQRIVEEARAQGAALLVLGHKKKKKQPTTWRLLMIWAGKARPINRPSFVDYCINHSPCMAIAVRKKSKTLGGYTLTTKRHKDFWLLA